MLFEQIIANSPSYQAYEYIRTEIEGKHHLVLHLESRRRSAEERGPCCNGHVHICGNSSTRLRDMPFHSGTRQDLEIS